jgi:hypothetical protein
MEAELLAGKLNMIAKGPAAISDEARNYLQMAAAQLIAVQDFRDAVDEAVLAVKNSSVLKDKVISALLEFDDIALQP